MNALAHNALVFFFYETAYESAARLAGQTHTYTVAQPAAHSGASPSPYTVNVRISPEDGNIVASVQVSDVLGHSTVMRGILVQAAPAPGSGYTPTYTTPAAH